jgi:hypothetical protein
MKSDPYNWLHLKLKEFVSLLKRRGDKTELGLQKSNEIKVNGKIL